MVGVSDTRFADPVREESTTYEIIRRTHEIPLDWFLVRNIVITDHTYEEYLMYEDLQRKSEGWSVNDVQFDYETERDPDGKGKFFRINCTSPENTERWLHFWTQDILDLLDYGQSTHEVAKITVDDSGDGLLLTIQERLPHLPKDASADSAENV